MFRLVYLQLLLVLGSNFLASVAIRVFLLRGACAGVRTEQSGARVTCAISPLRTLRELLAQPPMSLSVLC